MTRARAVLAIAAVTFWWLPTLTVAAAIMAPHVFAAWGVPYRARRVRRLIDRGRVDEAERVLDAIERDRRAAERLGISFGA